MNAKVNLIGQLQGRLWKKAPIHPPGAKLEVWSFRNNRLLEPADATVAACLCPLGLPSRFFRRGCLSTSARLRTPRYRLRRLAAPLLAITRTVCPNAPRRPVLAPATFMR